MSDKVRIITSSAVPSEIGEDLLVEMLGRLPEWRRNEALAYRRPLDRYLCAQAFFLLKDALKEAFGIEGEPEFEYEPCGKPRLAGHPEVHFNISHCSRCVCVAVADEPVGIDAEDIQFDMSVAESVLNSEEMQEVLGAADSAEAFTVLWTKKESFLKLTGTGLSGCLKDVLVDCGARFEIRIEGSAGYVVCVATGC